MTQFTAIDLSKLPAPAVIEIVDFEDVLADMIARYSVAVPELAENIQYESDPVRKLLEIAAYEKTLSNARVNSASKAVMLAFAKDADLDHLAALTPLERHDGETDDSFRARVQLAPEAFSVAGPRGGYEFHARKADPSVTDVYVDTFDLSFAAQTVEAQDLQQQIFTLIQEFSELTDQPPLGHVHVYVLAGPGGDLPAVVSAKVLASVNHEDVRPLTDRVQVKAPAVVGYVILAELTVSAGPDPETVRLAAEAAVQSYVNAQAILGGRPTLSGISAALHVAGVVSVNLLDPVALPEISPRQVPVCGTINVTLGAS